MGAGIPREIPGALDALAMHEAARLRFDVEGLARDDAAWLTFDPRDLWPAGVLPTEPLVRPAFLPVVSANSLATTLARKSNGRVDGFVVEGPTAGGHNAPPRGAMQLDDRGQPIYGARDAVDLAALRELGLPFWVAGGVGTPEGLRAARASGAQGIQVGTLFAFSDESGLAADITRDVLDAVRTGTARVHTDPRASPTGYPFKVVQMVSSEHADTRTRICDLGYLRIAVASESGALSYRCPSEPVDAWLKKGGAPEDTAGRRCLCNGLLADVGYAQERDGEREPPLITSGDDLASLAHVAAAGSYRAADVIAWLLQAER